MTNINTRFPREQSGIRIRRVPAPDERQAQPDHEEPEEQSRGHQEDDAKAPPASGSHMDVVKISKAARHCAKTAQRHQPAPDVSGDYTRGFSARIRSGLHRRPAPAPPQAAAHAMRRALSPAEDTHQPPAAIVRRRPPDS